MIEYDQTVLWPQMTEDVSTLKTNRLTSLLKWAGGKEQELKYILPLIPSFTAYYEPFVGGGAVFFSIQSQKKFINDKSPDLFNLYIAYSRDECTMEELHGNLVTFVLKHITEFNELFEAFFGKDAGNFIREIQRNLLSKTKRMKELEKRKWKLPEDDIIANIECALKSAFYMHLRYLYNKIDEYGIPPT